MQIILYVFFTHRNVTLFTQGHINLFAPKLYIILAQNLSVCIAFYGLLKFYHGVEKELGRWGYVDAWHDIHD